MTWQAGKQDSGGYPVTRDGRESTSLTDSDRLTDSVRTEYVGDTSIVSDYAGDAFSLAPNGTPSRC